MSVLEDEKEFTFIWKIENFSMLPHKSGNWLKSPVFVVHMWKGIKWHLKLYPRGCKNGDGDHLACFLSATDPEKKDFKVNFTMTLESTEPTEEITLEADYPLPNHDWGWKNFCSLTKLYAEKYLYLPQDILSLCCKFRAKDSNYEELSEEKKTECATNFLKKEYISRTSIQVQQVSITWPIQNISTRRERIETSFTELKDSPGLKVTLNFSEIANNVCVPIEIQQISAAPLIEKQERLFLKCKITVVSVSKEYQESKESTHLFKLAHNDVWHFPSFIKISNLTRDKYLNLEDTLLLQCEFIFSYKSGIIHWVDNCAPFAFEPRKRNKKITWSTSVQNLCASGKFSDIEIKAGGEIFPAHKLVLCARSSVFSAMFENDMKEKISGVVEIEDVDPPTLKRMLTFITFDDLKETDLSNEDVCKLYEAADKYNIESLKDWCTTYFTSHLSVESVYDVLVLANTHNDNLLMTSARNFVCCHENEIFDSPHWKSFMDCNIKLSANIMHTVIVNRNRIGNN